MYTTGAHTLTARAENIEGDIANVDSLVYLRRKDDRTAADAYLKTLQAGSLVTQAAGPMPADVTSIPVSPVVQTPAVGGGQVITPLAVPEDPGVLPTPGATSEAQGSSGSPFLFILLLVVVGAFAALIISSRHRKTRKGVSQAEVSGILTLTQVSGAQAGRMVQYTQPLIRIGRKRDGNDLILEGAEISREMAIIVKTDQGYLIRSLNPANPVFVNMKPIQEDKLLKPGDEIRIGTNGFLVN